MQLNNSNIKALKNQQSHDTPMESSKLISLFKAELKGFYQAEKVFIRLFPLLIKKARSQDIVETLKSHLAETEDQIQKVDRFFKSIEKK